MRRALLRERRKIQSVLGPYEGAMPSQYRPPAYLSMISRPQSTRGPQWKQSRHHRYCQPAGSSRPRAPVSAQVTIGSGTTAPNPTDGWCSGVHRRQRSASRRRGHPTLCTAEYSARKSTPRRAREPTPIAQLPVALSTFYSENNCFDIRP
jgi:hypothetical protein